ncbi:NUDIX hydrolase [Vibrio sp. RE86]|uniref:NUDIX hydrolase n=1 Tax=Vibrio sp. RE86 TaxID=2607605 RepID=UPI00149390BB|nr:NUDIX hydrolase [Vibrio sp. RE86]NOH81725.1 NUDIX hydrolase [Vibrio sp. RE86]
MKHLSMAVVIKDGKVLVQERSQEQQSNSHLFPGGQVHDNESATEAARGLINETFINDIEHTATFSGRNDLGGRTYYSIFKTKTVEQKETSRSSFQWLAPKEILAQKVNAADADFIKKHLVECE